MQVKAGGKALPALVLTLIAIGCGSSGGSQSGGSGDSDGGGGGGAGGGSGSCVAGGIPGTSMSWDDDGVSECAVSASVTETSGSTVDLVEVVGATPTVGLAFGVSTQGIPISGAYVCGASTAYQLSFTYVQGTTSYGFAQSCAITIDPSPTGDGGTRVSGTFSGVFSSTGGGTKTISNGVFAAPATVVATQ